MVMVYLGGNISGAHYNPAVTLAVLIRGKITGKEAGIYMLFQILGATSAAIMYWLIWGRTFAPAPNPDINVLKPLAIEMLFTFALASVVLNVATSAKAAGNSYYGLAIGFTVLAAAIAGGAISGGAFNPAVGIGPCLIDTLCGSGNMNNLWIYIVGPLAGGAVAGFFYKIANPDD